MPREKPADRLETYRAKRSGDRTPEPFGGADLEEAAPLVAPAPAETPWRRARLFCVQKHAARRLHYDFRIELGGVLRSWAVPKGPSTDVAEKRFAAEVEDHPVEYADFEGVIPEGNYGAGHVIVWDRGLWVPLEDPEQGFLKGKLLFELFGHKLRGVWTLVRIKGQPGSRGASKDWLLIKHAGDAWAGPDGMRYLTPESIYSGLTLEEVREGQRRAEEIRAELQRLGAPRKPVDPRKLKLMLAETREAGFDEPGWLFELKYDGYRVIASCERGEPHLFYRRGSESTAVFPEIARAVRGLPFEHLVLDGEIVVLDPDARPSFQRLQRRALLQRAPDIARAAIELPASYYVFDLLGFEDFDLRPLPLAERKALLRRVLPPAGPVRFTDHLEGHGAAFYEEVSRLGLEGIMAKRADSPYRAGRTREWLKLRVDRTDDFVVVGMSPAEGHRTGFGALHVAQYDTAGGRLEYAGRVGSGFTEKQLSEIQALLTPLRRPAPPCSGPTPKDKSVWVEPVHVCEVRYKEWTEEHLLRQPVFLRLRDDKPPEECVRRNVAPELDAEAAQAESPAGPVPAKRAAQGRVERETTRESVAPEPASARSLASSVEKKVVLSNRGKLFWPDDGYTKGELLDYYRDISPWLLPYLKDRPVVLTRYPDGIAGKNFFQKDAPPFVPGWMRLERMWSEDTQKETDFFVCDDLETLLFIINLGTIPLHVWSSRVATLQNPDWCILDLDPKGAPFEHVVEIARAIHELADAIGLPAFPKTSGSSGLHVLFPTGLQLTFEQTKTLGELLARVVARELPEIATVIRNPSARGGKVYVDFLQNGHGKLLAGPFSARPVPGATCSAPLKWSEVKSGLDPKAFTLKTLPERMRKLKQDPLAGVLREKPELAAALARLSQRLAEV
jgi:bifunctional non-homologous end joining protein LigD